MQPVLVQLVVSSHSTLIFSKNFPLCATGLNFTEIQTCIDSVSNQEDGTTPGYSFLALHKIKDAGDQNRTLYPAIVSRKTQKSCPLLICLYMKSMKGQQNTFGTVQAFVQQMALWPNTGLYKRHDQTEQDSFAVDLLPETYRCCGFLSRL